MVSALVIGGTGFIGRHTAEELHDNGYEVTTLSRSTPEREFTDRDAITHISADRTDDAALRDVAHQVEPVIVIDCAAFYPDDVQAVLDVFADVDVYVYVSSGAVYSVQEIPKREDETPLHDCTSEQAADDSMASYGPRKAECDRITTEAAERGIPAMSVRPTVVYGPQPGDSAPLDDAPAWAEDMPGIQTHHDYWIDRINRYDKIVVPGDGTAIWHRVYVEDLARALRVVAEDGEPGEAYNAGDRRVCTLGDVIELIADALDTTIEVIHASRRELGQVGLTPNDFIMYHHPMTEYPHVVDTCKLASLGWDSTFVEAAMERTVEESLASNRDGSTHDPGREAEERLLDAIVG
ncbi:NAD-dependent epimerase/dehydratase family protein [Haloarcula amylovorans]|uniref:NAD-dependent epimerase/dehydratase family protein n=1 Tax=Haloarcula amylovorans TaxID=2562280 RepID=UPI001076A549|nr:NAD-dependent epimerase/dehydratase family protein [Halomicroarcula amylolytica]